MVFSIRPNTRLSAIIAAIALALTLPVAAHAANAGKEIATATDHAGYAAKADEVAKVHLHLHHVINCLVGPNGSDFDKKSGNPCDGQGNGAINDVGSDMADQKSSLEDILALAKSGIQQQSLDAAQTTARKVEKMLKKSG